MKPSTRTSPSSDIYHHSASDSLLQHKPCTDIRRSSQYKNGVSIVPPASTSFCHAFTMSGKQPFWCKQGQSQNTDLVFHIQLLSWENENCYKILWTTLVWGQLPWTGGLNISLPPGRISFQRRFGPVRSGRAGSDSLCLMLNQFRAASESLGRRSASTAGTWWGRRQFNRENDNP